MSRHLHLLILLYVLLIVVPQGCDANIEANLIQTLLKDYDASARPIINKSNAIDVNIDLVLHQIVNLDERQQQLEIKVWQRSDWHDDFLTWNASEHGGIDSITLDPTRIWRPHIVLYNDMNESPNEDYAPLFESIVTNDGTVRWYVSHIITSNCRVDVSYYPFDEQKCTLKFGSWSHDGAKLDLFNMSTAGNLIYYTPSVEWDILAFDVKKNMVQYNCCPNPYPDVTFTLHIRRKHFYYINSLILPCIFITSTALLVFYLPPESGEKITLSVTIMLTLFVFMLFIAESVPKSDSAPLIGLYIKVLIAILSCSTGLAVVVLRIHHRGVFGNKVPNWIRKVVLEWMACVLCMKRKVDGEFPSSMSTEKSSVLPTPIGHDAGNVELIAVKAIHTQDMLTVNSKPVGKLEDQNVESMAPKDGRRDEDHQEACNRDWMLVAAVVDRFLLIAFIIVTVASTAFILLSHTYSHHEPIA